ncbi:MAG TPA: type II secretion system major pseudopilin GspG [Pirellulales bacterium]|nr:type II secretion system major pseudopilin GspG [Pirellulales bacterium]
MSGIHARRPSRAAFTLMEVLLVLVILVVLGSLAVGMFTGAQKRANLNAAQVQVEAISDQCERYNLDMNAYPTTLDQLFTNPGGPKADAWTGPYLTKEVPLDPWGNPYQIQSPGARHPDKVDVWSYGPDGQNGTQDDIYNH